MILKKNIALISCGVKINQLGTLTKKPSKKVINNLVGRGLGLEEQLSFGERVICSSSSST